jgi:hypothetical protein
MLDRRFSGVEYSVHFGANLHLGELVELEGLWARTDGGFPSLALSLSESNGSTEVKKQLSRRGDSGTVKLGCYFHTHDFE